MGPKSLVGRGVPEAALHRGHTLAERSRPRRRVGDALASIDEQYDAVFIDCPPGITLANESAMRAAQVYLSPVVPSSLSVRAFDQLAAYVAENPKADGMLLGFLSMVDRRKRGHRELAERLPRERSQMLRSSVPASAAVEAAPQQGAPFVSGRSTNRASIAYRDLWTEVQKSAFGHHHIDLTAEHDRPPLVSRPR
jgi:cellulose biosynthesis protein BcsQ